MRDESIRGHREYYPEDEGFKDLLGSPNGRTMMRMLLDQKSEIGYKTVGRIILVGHKDPDLTKAETRTFLVVLSSKRDPDWNFHAKVASHSSTCFLIALGCQADPDTVSVNI